jgi:hypothetical protein
MFCPCSSNIWPPYNGYLILLLHSLGGLLAADVYLTVLAVENLTAGGTHVLAG